LFQHSWAELSTPGNAPVLWWNDEEPVWALADQIELIERAAREIGPVFPVGPLRCSLYVTQNETFLRGVLCPLKILFSRCKYPILSLYFETLQKSLVLSQ
jgi:hypothetical protein